MPANTIRPGRSENFSAIVHTKPAFGFQMSGTSVPMPAEMPMAIA